MSGNPYNAEASEFGRWTLSATVLSLSAWLVTSVVSVNVIMYLQEAAVFEVFLWMALWVVPVGALLTGMAASSGWWLSIAFFRLRPTTRLALVTAVGSALLAPVIYVARYQSAMGDNFFDILLYPPLFKTPFLTHLAYELSHHVYTTASGGITDLGDWWWGVAALHFLGLAAGSQLGFLILRRARRSVDASVATEADGPRSE